MKHCVFLGVAVLAGTAGVFAAPLTPTITGHDINFGAEFVYATNGSLPDTLVTSKDGSNSVGEEATAYWPAWPSTIGVMPIWYDLVVPGDQQYNFGGDLRLAVQFTGHDETPPPLDVSLIGTGLNDAPGAADLEVWGYINKTGLPDGPNVLLWAIDLDAVSLYGYGNAQSYVLEGKGTIVGGSIAQEKNLIGSEGVMRGNIDFAEGFAVPGAIKGLPSRYDPAKDVRVVGEGSYSGETGRGFAVPEPVTLALLLIGSVVGLRRRIGG